MFLMSEVPLCPSERRVYCQTTDKKGKTFVEEVIQSESGREICTPASERWIYSSATDDRKTAKRLT